MRPSVWPRLRPYLIVICPSKQQFLLLSSLKNTNWEIFLFYSTEIKTSSLNFFVHQSSAFVHSPELIFNYTISVLLRVNEQRNVLHEIRKRKTNWIGHILRRNCLLKQVIEGKIKVEMEVIRRRKKLLDDLKDRRGYYHLKEEVLDRTVWRNRFGGDFGPVVRQNTE